MQYFNINQDTINYAHIKAQELGKLNNSVLDGEGNITGFIGECIVNKYLNSMIYNTYNFDIIYNNIRIDVKTQKLTIYKKKPYPTCSIQETSKNQKCDIFVFVCINFNKTYGWILGFLEKDNYIKESILYKAGQFNYNQRFKYKYNCLVLPTIKLKDIKYLK